MSAQSRSAIVSLLQRHGVQPRKAYGQHFLADPNLIAKVVATAAVQSSDRVLEVGAGTGALTRALAHTGARLISYEIDQRMRPLLVEALEGLEVDLRFADAMEVDLVSVLDGGEWKLVANLPYNVGTPLLLDILMQVPAVAVMVVMVQREVADRLIASAGAPDYGVPSVVVGLTARITERFDVPPQVFVPPPNVGSSVLRLDRITPPPLLSEAVTVARTAFGQRRKMLRRSLADRVDPAHFEALGIDPTARPEQLTPQQFVELAQEVADA